MAESRRNTRDDELMGGGGKVYLVGAGPGDPGLITLRGVECLRRADVVLYDYLVNAAILSHAPPRAERICLGRHGRSTVWDQPQINQALAEHALAGRVVVRLKGGDPAVFGRMGEEAEYLARRGVPFEMVPGITTALAAASYAGIPVTHRDLASAVALVTGQEDADKCDSALDFDALARFPGTLVFYMGVTTVESWASQLMTAGKSPDTPAAIVRRCSLPDQQVIACTLGSLTDHLVPATRLRPPVIVILGPVVQLAPVLSWFDKRPLFGTTVLVTRPAEQASSLVDQLGEFGARVRVQPAIEIGPPEDWSPVDATLNRLHDFDWVVFSSANGVRYWLDRLEATGRDLRSLSNVRLAAIGPGTAEELRRYRLKADLVPPEFRAESLASVLAQDADGKRFLLVRASRGREVLATELTAASGLVEQVVAYSSRDVAGPDPEIAEELCSGRIDWITVTSSAIARSLVRLFGADLSRAKLASISPITTATLRECGHEPAAEATAYTMPGIVAALATRVQTDRAR